MNYVKSQIAVWAAVTISEMPAGIPVAAGPRLPAQRTNINPGKTLQSRLVMHYKLRRPCLSPNRMRAENIAVVVFGDFTTSAGHRTKLSHAKDVARWHPSEVKVEAAKGEFGNG